MTPQFETLLALANEEAAGAGLSFIWPQHVLIAMLREPELAAGKTLLTLGLDVHETREAARNLVRSDDVVVSGRLPAHPYTRRALRRATRIAAACSHVTVDDAHLLLALIENPRRPASRLLARLKVNPDHVRRLLLRAGETPAHDAQQPVALAYHHRAEQRPWWKQLFGR